MGKKAKKKKKITTLKKMCFKYKDPYRLEKNGKIYIMQSMSIREMTEWLY
jgi:hypothetical protein